MPGNGKQVTSPSVVQRKNKRVLPEESDSDDDEKPITSRIKKVKAVSEDTRTDAYEAAHKEYEALVEQANDVFSDDDWEDVAPGVPMSWIGERRDVGAIEGMIDKIKERLEARTNPAAVAAASEPADDDEEDEEEEENARIAAVEDGGESEGEEEEEEEDEEDEEDEEGDGKLEAPVVDDPVAQAPSWNSIAESNVTQYATCVYGVPDEYIVKQGVPMPFKSAEDMNKMLNSKSPTMWDKVRSKHMSILRNDDRLKPTGWYPGKPDAPSLEELPYETFYYIQCYVEPNPGNPDSVLKAEHDKMLMRNLHRQVANKLHERFERVVADDKREELAPVLDWKEPSVPQVNPEVTRWPSYKDVKLMTAFAKRESVPRARGSQAKSGRSGKKKAEALVQLPQGGFIKRAQPESEEPSDATSSSALTQAVPPSVKARKAGGAGSAGASSSPSLSQLEEAVKSFRTIDVANGAKTHVYVHGNRVHIVEHN